METFSCFYQFGKLQMSKTDYRQVNHVEAILIDFLPGFLCLSEPGPSIFYVVRYYPEIRKLSTNC
jgi:hypothetical protein